MAKLKKLPIGIQTFSKLRDNDYLYVDKTDIIYNLVTEGSYYFLSRPRRFGKSLLISTLQALFEGREKLFQNLAVYDKWDWSTSYPVIKISFAGVARNLDDMKTVVRGILRSNQDRLQIQCQSSNNSGIYLREMIEKAYEKYGQKVVILVDEYDKLIVDNLDQPEIAREGREVLRDLYTIIKDSDEYIKFAFLTGVSKFSRVSIFSGLNNLEDISLSRNFATLCGYTQKDLETVFADHLQGADMGKVRDWYNGYNFLGEPVYNPFDILLFIKNGQIFKNYWFSTGTPTFLIKLIQRNNYFIPNLNNLKVSEALIDSYDIDNIELVPILFQTGYLTISRVEESNRGGIWLTLNIPNKEVQLSFNDMLIDYFTNQPIERIRYQDQLYDLLEKGDVARLEPFLFTLFAAIPYNNYVNNTINDYEGYYASVIYAYLASLGMNIIAEDVTNKGRIDLTVNFDKNIYIIEFKVDGQGSALEQIKAKNYQEKYLDQDKTIYIVGIDFDSQEKNISGFKWEEI